MLRKLFAISLESLSFRFSGFVPAFIANSVLMLLGISLGAAMVLHPEPLSDPSVVFGLLLGCMMLSAIGAMVVAISQEQDDHPPV